MAMASAAAATTRRYLRPTAARFNLSAAMSTDTTSKHYERHTTASYESAYFYSPGRYTEWLCDLVRSTLRVGHTGSSGGVDGGGTAPPRRLIDIGGGTGNFTKTVIEGVPGMDAVVIDPFLEGGSGGDESSDSIKFVKESAEAFAAPSAEVGSKRLWWKENYHQILMKEVVHHFAESDRADIFRGMRTGLAGAALPGEAPSVLIVTRPQVDIDYPMWPAARKVWAQNQPSAEEIESDLTEAGFSGVGHEIHAYPCEIELERWLGMVRGRFWSTFSNFSDEELEEACDLIRKEARVDSEGVARFEDRLVFIKASR